MFKIWKIWWNGSITRVLTRSIAQFNTLVWAPWNPFLTYLKSYKIIILCCFKPLCLWQFASVALKTSIKPITHEVKVIGLMREIYNSTITFGTFQGPFSITRHKRNNNNSNNNNKNRRFNTTSLLNLKGIRIHMHTEHSLG